MPRRRRSYRRGDGGINLLLILVLAMILLILVSDGRIADIQMPRYGNLPELDLPELNLPRIDIPITGLPEINIPEIRVPVTVEPGDLVPELRLEGTPVPGNEILLFPQARASGCQLQGSLPDPACTPGAVTGASQDQVCEAGFVAQDLSADQSEAVFAMYGIPEAERGQYQIDHLVPLALSGTNGSANLWPQPAGGQPGPADKDALETHLREQVCAGELTLEAAQQQLAVNWLASYYRME